MNLIQISYNSDMGVKIILTDNHLHWQDLIHCAAQRGQTQLPEKSYQFTNHILENLVNEPDFYAHDFCTTKIMSCLQAQSTHTIAEAADHCLILLGLFPNRLAKYHIDPDHLVTTGKALYDQLDYHPKYMTTTALSPIVVKPYYELIELMLHIREPIWEHEPLTKDYAYHLWQSTGSRYAQRLLYQGETK